MLRAIMGLAVATTLSVSELPHPAGAADPQIGDPAPEFQCRDDRGELWDSRDHVGKKWVVMYFYQSDFAFCCTRQAQRYRDCQCEFDELEAEVVGISGDVVAAHEEFKATHELNYSLLADENGDVARQFGVDPLRPGGKAMVSNARGETVFDAFGKPLSFPRRVTAARWTFIIDPDGRVIYRAEGVSSAEDTRQALEFLRARNANRAAGPSGRPKRTGAAEPMAPH